MEKSNGEIEHEIDMQFVLYIYIYNGMEKGNILEGGRRKGEEMVIDKPSSIVLLEVLSKLECSFFQFKIKEETR